MRVSQRINSRVHGRLLRGRDTSTGGGGDQIRRRPRSVPSRLIEFIVLSEFLDSLKVKVPGEGRWQPQLSEQIRRVSGSIGH